MSIFPCQIASICRNPDLDQYDLTSVNLVITGGSLIYPKYEREIFDKLPNMTYLYVVSWKDMIQNQKKKKKFGEYSLQFQLGIRNV